MKKPKKINRYCPHCKKHTPHKISQAKTGHKRGSLKRGSIARAAKRGLGIGFGNKGRWGSKPTKPKMTGQKLTKKTNLVYGCTVCKKSHLQKQGIRAKKFEVI